MAVSWNEISAESQSGYTALQSSGDHEFVSLPTRSVLEFTGGPAQMLGPGDSLIEYGVKNSKLVNTPGGRMFEAGDSLSVRGIFWSPSDISLLHDGLGFAKNGVMLDQFDPMSEARELLHLGEVPTGTGRSAVPGHFNAFARDVKYTVPETDPDGAVTLVSTTGDLATGKYAHAAGAVYALLDQQTQHRKPGLYYSALADASWSYVGFGSDRQSVSSLDKVFTESQFTHWLDVTTLDVNQPVVFVYYLAAEPDHTGTAASKIEGMVDQAASSAMALGLTSVRHLLVMPHFHRIIGLNDVGVTRSRFERQRDAMFEIADRRAEVSAVSIYDATDGVLLDGSVEARDWLRSKTTEPFQYAGRSVDLADGPMLGDLLDSPDLHPVNEDAAAFYSKIFLDALFGAAQIDFNQDGVLDNGDIGFFVGLFLAGDTAADLNGDGLIDNGDINAFVAAFLAGC